MKKELVLAEKPSVAREIAKVLKCTRNKGGYIEGDKYIITWALGHLVGLQDPEGYGNEYKTWSMATLPMMPEKMKLVVLKKTSKQFNEVKQLLNRADVSNIIVATDAGREGELVAKWTIIKAGCKKPIKRLWISSQTNKAIQDGFKNLKPGRDYENLFKAAECRATADWLVGLNVTRGLTCKYNAQLSAGRVQSPTLSLIVIREEEIKSFKPKKYNIIIAKTKSCNFTFTSKNNNVRIFDLNASKEIENKLTNSEITIMSVVSKSKKMYPKPLYDLTELQRDCNKLWNFSAKDTLNIMQRLYENHKALTYPRTDSRYITTDVVETLKDRVKAISFGEYKIVCDTLLKSNIQGSKNFVDNSKVSDHHAIIPTEERANLQYLSLDEKRVYNLVIKRFLSHLLTPFIYTETTLEGNVSNEKLIAKGRIIQEKGWKKLYDTDIDEENGDDVTDQTLPIINKGDKIAIKSVYVKEELTTPPPRFNEATLLSAMETPQKYIELDKESAKTLNETGGLGTVATRADIIEKLFNSFVIEKKGKDIHPTSKGKQLIELVPTDLKTPLLTAKWEKRLDAISKGKDSPDSFLKEIREYTISLVKDVKLANNSYKHENITGKKCPNCSKFLLKVKGKKGVMNVCQDRECGYRENVSFMTNAKCPKCRKKLEIVGEGDKKMYVCQSPTCMFREKASKFEERFEKKVDKKEVNKIISDMKKETKESFNNPFAGFNIK